MRLVDDFDDPPSPETLRRSRLAGREDLVRACFKLVDGPHGCEILIILAGVVVAIPLVVVAVLWSLVAWWFGGG